MKMTCGCHFGDISSCAQQFRRVLLDHDFALEIEPGGKAEIFVRRPGVAINAAVLAAAIRIEAGAETDVRAVVAGDDGLAVVLEKLRARSLRTATILVVGIPVRVRFELDFLEPVRRIFRRAATCPVALLRRVDALQSTARPASGEFNAKIQRREQNRNYMARCQSSPLTQTSSHYCWFQHGYRFNVALDLLLLLVTRTPQIIVGLQARPHFRAGAEIPRQPQAVSAVMPRFSRTISLMRRGGTFNARASAFCDRPRGFINSSRRISPG